MRAVDTNVLVRLITRDDAHQTAAAERYIEPGAWVPLLALAESTWVLSSVYSLDAKAIATAIEMLLNHRSLVLEEPGAIAAALDLFRAKPTLGFSDCLMLHITRQTGHVPLGTFDRNLSKQDGAQRI